MGPSLPNEDGKLAKGFKGLNERTKFVSQDPADWDTLVGLVQSVAGRPQRMNGIAPLQLLSGLKILAIKQTFDDRQNVIVQTDQGVYLYSEGEMMNNSPSTNLIPVTLAEEETMSRALIYHTQASGVTGGAMAVANTWTTATLNQLVEQLNPDGSAAAFVTALAANVFTLAAGTYRFTGLCQHCDNAGNSFVKSRLFNVTTGLPAWNGLQHEESSSCRVADNFPVLTQFQGTLVLAVPTQFRIEYWMSTASTAGDTSAFGRPSTTGKPEVYIELGILKTN